MANAPLARILRESAGADLLELLAERLAPTDLQSLLLEVYRRRASQQTPAAVLASYERSRMLRPSPCSPARLLDFDRLAMSLAPLFEPVELAPICPLATNSAVATVDQNQTIATIRNTELVSDSTNVLALECASRRRECLRTPARRHEHVRLCASHRLLRPQAASAPGTFAHFRLFALCTAGRDQGSYRFELAALSEQLALYARLFAALPRLGYMFQAVRVALTDLSDGVRQAVLQAQVLDPLAAQFPDIAWGFDPQRQSGRHYYSGLSFAIYATAADNHEYFLADGGFTTWSQQLLNNQKERLLISGIGTERLCQLFWAQSESE